MKKKDKIDLVKINKKVSREKNKLPPNKTLVSKKEMDDWKKEVSEIQDF